jgi:uncharacterized protein
MDIAAALRGARDRAGLTQRELAQRANTSQAAIARYETGAAVPSIGTLRRILAAAEHDLTLSVTSRRRAFTGPVGSEVEKHRSRLQRILEQYAASRPRVFGSVARGEDRDGSDLDLLVHIERPDYILLEELRAALEEELGRPVDLAIESLLRDEVRERSFSEAVPL